tara:strand:+ start:404 stop:556 length:153 start_codon:yes stop_codon:yes gene_type:complete
MFSKGNSSEKKFLYSIIPNSRQGNDFSIQRREYILIRENFKNLLDDQVST